MCGDTVEVVRNDEDGTLARRAWQPPCRTGAVEVALLREVEGDRA
jgi:hypothetical protein